ncbi:MAG TPA: PLP-dependent aminotransferase family protein [Candidatus Cloacimonadota bacterium]|nr:PLP-dependent aminotransferase family protein [Candidatus Cloacimonadota bacterium]HPS37892.1 PLP-dependent aminotransferase family protein [Candidatus Cloacimonadota bacterium]
MNYREYFSKTTLTMKSSLIRELVATTKTIPGLISFAGGFPSPQTFPKDILSDIYYDVVKNEGYDVLQYGQSEGDTQLKQQLINWEGYKGLSHDEMLVTVGATNAIYYYTRAMIDPGDVIICEAPSFLGCLVAFEAAGADLQGVGMDAEGLSITELKAKVSELRGLGKKIKFVYTIPDFHNPGGITMSLARRKQLIDFCTAEHLAILEDNPYGRLRYSGDQVPTLYHIAREDYNNHTLVTEVVSFSKILGPGMRLAFVKGESELVNKMVSWQQKINVSPDCVTERVAARFLEEGFLNPHIKTICGFYQPYLKKMLECLADEMPSNVTWTQPEGGIFIWVTLPEHENTDTLFNKAMDHKVAFIPGSKFYPSNQEKYNSLRLNFTYSTLEQIAEGTKRLGTLMRSL